MRGHRPHPPGKRAPEPPPPPKKVAGAPQSILAHPRAASVYATLYGRLIHDAITDCARQVSRRDNEILMEVCATFLPRGLKWMAGRRRLLRIVYRLRPNWRPTVNWGVDGDILVGVVKDANGISYLLGARLS